MNVGVLGRAIGAQDTMSDNNEPRAPSTNDQDNDFQYPEGGQRGNIVLLGSFMALMGGLGLMNSIGIYQARISTAQLPDISDGQIGWIFGVYNFMAFFCGIQIGPIFDNFGPTWLMMAAFVLYVAFFVLLSFCQSYWQYFVVIGIVGGAATSIIFVVPVACLGQYFNKKRGSATGLAMSGGSLGGITFPLLLDHLWDRIGFSWGTRAVGLITIVLVLSGCLLIRPNRACRRNTATNAKRSILPDFSILLIPSVVMLTAGVFFIEWGFFVGLEYIASYALSHGIDKEQAYQMVVYLNAGSFPGRWLPGIAADKFGRLNTMIATNVLCAIAMLAVWLPANGNLAATIIFAVVFGFASGSNISLVPVCVGELCTTQGYGRYYTTVYTVVSIGALTGVPIAGQILHATHSSYEGLIIFAGLSYIAGLVCFGVLKIYTLKQRRHEASEGGKRSSPRQSILGGVAIETWLKERVEASPSELGDCSTVAEITRTR